MKKYRATTSFINVDVIPTYMGQRLFNESYAIKNDKMQEFIEYKNSFPNHVWKYTVEITNNSGDTIKIVGRHLFYVSYMHKFKGHIMEVSGKGIDKSEPILFPETSFTYHSLTYLQTPKGLLYGHYVAETIHKNQILIQIPPTALEFESKPK